VIYQIYPRSFADASGDGVGDLEGIRRRLAYLAWLGVDALWLSPVFPSPMADFGYDVSDYCDIDPLFGTLADFDRLLGGAHRRGMRLILDWVPNHTSDRHPWFLASRSSRADPKRDWYVWRDRPNNWPANFGGSAWTYDAATDQWYLHSYLAEQPDLDWRNPEVVAAMLGTLRFWLDRGVDGFRVDAVRRLGKDPAYRDNPPNPDWQPGMPENQRFLPVHSLNHPDVHGFLRKIRGEVAPYEGERVLLGEVYLPTVREIFPYYGRGDELHLAFMFPLLHAPWEAAAWRACLEEVYGECERLAAWPAWVLSNHDVPRHRTRFGSEARARVAAVLLLTLRGTPQIYAGEELGLEDAEIPPERVRDPGGRDGCRAPIPWEGGPGHGWGEAEVWLPWPPDADRRNVAAQRRDRRSMLHLYRRLLALRRASAALREGTWRVLDSPEGTLAYAREAERDERLVVANFGDVEVPFEVGGGWTMALSSAGAGGGGAYAGFVPGETAIILRPRD
jgi:alpha-glucosidase